MLLAIEMLSSVRSLWPREEKCRAALVGRIEDACAISRTQRCALADHAFK
jgi:hypothetical protein